MGMSRLHDMKLAPRQRGVGHQGKTLPRAVVDHG